jgi:AraC-like DNA-binding protein
MDRTYDRASGGVLNAGAEWTQYRRAPGLGVEAMGAHFVGHVYDRHSHDAYSFGVTEDGAQAFRCRGATRVSTAGLVMAFNPDDPHDGHAGSPTGFTYRMVHIDPGQVRDALAEAGCGDGLPLFPEPVIHDRELVTLVRRTADAVLAGDEPLHAQESLDRMLLAAVRRHAPHTGRTGVAVRAGRAGSDKGVRLVRELLHEQYVSRPLDDHLSADELAQAAGLSRFQMYRLFREACGLSPSAYLRQLRLRSARRLLAAGEPPARVASVVGFADQAHLTRWFRRTYGITPAVYQRA